MTAREPGELLRQQHDLLLVDRDAVGVAQVLLHVGDLVGHRPASFCGKDNRGIYDGL